MIHVGNRCLDIIASTSEIISYGVRKYQWCARIFLWGPRVTQRSKINPFQKNRVQTSDSRRLKKWDWTSRILHYEPNVLRMMENMGYDLMKKSGLNFGIERRTLLRSFISKGKAPDYYHKTWRGLGYISTPIPSTSESEESLYYDHSSGTSSWESNVSVSSIFKELSMNMVSTSHPEEENEEMI